LRFAVSAYPEIIGVQKFDSSSRDLGHAPFGHLLIFCLVSITPVRLQNLRLVALAYLEITASEEVTLQLIKSKCLPVLLNSLEACPLTMSDLHSLDFVINRFFTKLFKTSNIETVKKTRSSNSAKEPWEHAVS